MAKKGLTSSRARTTQKKELTAEEQEQALLNIRQKKVSKPKSKFYGRVTVDFPDEVYEEMKAYTQEDGRTLKGYIISLVKKDLRTQ